MPPLAPAPQTLRVRTLWTDDAGTPHGIRQFFEYSAGAPTSAELILTADNMIAAAWPYLAAVMSTEKTLTEVIIEDLTSDMGAVGLATGTEPGTLTGSFLPSSVVAIGNFRIARRHRGGQPRTALPFGIQSELLNAQQWETTAVTNFLNALENYIGAILTSWAGGGSLQHVDTSYVNLGVKRPVAVNYPIIGYAVNQRVGAARRRLGRSSG